MIERMEKLNKRLKEMLAMNLETLSQEKKIEMQKEANAIMQELHKMNQKYKKE